MFIFHPIPFNHKKFIFNHNKSAHTHPYIEGPVDIVHTYHHNSSHLPFKPFPSVFLGVCVYQMAFVALAFEQLLLTSDLPSRFFQY